jgi:hypothetical protein
LQRVTTSAPMSAASRTSRRLRRIPLSGPSSDSRHLTVRPTHRGAGNEPRGWPIPEDGPQGRIDRLDTDGSGRCHRRSTHPSISPLIPCGAALWTQQVAKQEGATGHHRRSGAHHLRISERGRGRHERRSACDSLRERSDVRTVQKPAMPTTGSASCFPPMAPRKEAEP